MNLNGENILAQARDKISIIKKKFIITREKILRGIIPNKIVTLLSWRSKGEGDYVKICKKLG